MTKTLAAIGFRVGRANVRAFFILLHSIESRVAVASDVVNTRTQRIDRRVGFRYSSLTPASLLTLLLTRLKEVDAGGGLVARLNNNLLFLRVGNTTRSVSFSSI